MKKYRYLDHTSEVKFQAFGMDLEEAFANAALAMFNIMVDTEKVRDNIKKEISVDGANEKSLLFNFLDELIFLINTEGFLLHKVESLVINGSKVKAVLVGDNISEIYETNNDVKAVTYHDMEINKGDNVVVQVVVDV